MSNFLKLTIFLSVLAIGFASCSTSEKTQSASSSSMYPEWYNTAEFSADSAAFHGFGIAISSDSVIAMANAELQARANLETAVAEKMEAVRNALEEEGNSSVQNADFILTLRNAHNQVQEAAKSNNEAAQFNDRYYTGFAQVTISKTEFLQLMESGFSGKSGYWQSFSSSKAFEDEIQ